jgi:choice-of-anchor A domain-containing protein
MAVSKVFLVAAGLVLAANQARASLLDYNLALQNNLTGAVHVEGMSFIGGNLTATQLSEFNSGSDTPMGTFDGLEVGGKVSGQVKILGGETAVYKTKDASAQIQCVGSVNCATGGVDLSAKKQALSVEMSSLATSYQSLSSNASAVKNGNQVKLQYTGSDSLAVFNLNSSDLFFQNSSIELVLGNASKAIINVSGNLNVINTNLTGAWNYSNTLWNFYDATSLSFNAMAVKGSVLAYGADVFNGGGFDGSLYAKSYTNSSLREIHGFFWTPPTTNTVPEPQLLTLMLSGLALMGLARLRRRA